MAGMARGYSRADRIRPGRARPATYKCDSRTPRGRDLQTRITLLSRIIALRRMDRGLDCNSADSPVRYRCGARIRGMRTGQGGLKRKRMALRDCSRRFLRRGEVLAPGAFCAPCG